MAQRTSTFADVSSTAIQHVAGSPVNIPGTGDATFGSSVAGSSVNIPGTGDATFAPSNTITINTTGTLIPVAPRPLLPSNAFGTPAPTGTPGSVVPESDPAPQSHDSTSSSPTVPIGAFIGAVLAAMVLTGLCTCYFRRRRRVARFRRPITASTGNVVSSSPHLPRQTALEPYIFAESTVDLVPPLVPPGGGNGRTGRRAVDAGPVSANAEEGEDDSASTLPPEYSDIFHITRSSTVSSRR